MQARCVGKVTAMPAEQGPRGADLCARREGKGPFQFHGVAPLFLWGEEFGSGAQFDGELARQVFHLLSAASRHRCRPSSVRGPVLIPPWNLHRPPRPRPCAWQGVPLRVRAPHLLRFAASLSARAINASALRREASVPRVMAIFLYFRNAAPSERNGVIRADGRVLCLSVAGFCFVGNSQAVSADRVLRDISDVLLNLFFCLHVFAGTGTELVRFLLHANSLGDFLLNLRRIEIHFFSPPTAVVFLKTGLDHRA